MFEDFEFRGGTISRKLVIFGSTHTVAFANPSPFLLQHLVVVPVVARKRLVDLSGAERIDLFSVVRSLVCALNADVDAFTVYMQDEECCANDHLHVHVVPRKSCDLKCNEDIYAEGALRVDTTSPVLNETEDAAATIRQRLEGLCLDA